MILLDFAKKMKILLTLMKEYFLNRDHEQNIVRAKGAYLKHPMNRVLKEYFIQSMENFLLPNSLSYLTSVG